MSIYEKALHKTWTKVAIKQSTMAAFSSLIKYCINPSINQS
jgi:hypothetical protein